VIWKWLTVFGLAAAPALVLGQSAAWAFGLRTGMNILALGIVITMGGFIEGVVIVKLAELPKRSARFERWADKVHRSRPGSWLAKRGPWPSLLVGTMFLGQEPIIIFLVWLGIPMRKLVVPLFVANAVYTVVYALLVKQGLADWDQISKLL
jgi:hypothetical protein